MALVGAFASASLRVAMASSMSSATFVMDRRVCSRSESAYSATERIDSLSEAAALISGTGFSAASLCGEAGDWVPRVEICGAAILAASGLTDVEDMASTLQLKQVTHVLGLK